MVPGGEEEDESAGARAAGAERGAAAEAAAGDGGHRLADEQQRQRGGAQPGRRVGAVHAVGPLLPRVRLHPRLAAGEREREREHKSIISISISISTESQFVGGGGERGARTDGRLCSAAMARPKATTSTTRMTASTLVESAMMGARRETRNRRRRPEISDHLVVVSLSPRARMNWPPFRIVLPAVFKTKRG